MQHAKPVDEITVHGIDEDVNECEHCGRVNLKYTVAISADGGPIVHYGRYCAATALRVGRASISAAIKTYRDTETAALRKERAAAAKVESAATDRWFEWLASQGWKHGDGWDAFGGFSAAREAWLSSPRNAAAIVTT